VKLGTLHGFMLLCSLALLQAHAQTNSASAIPHLETRGTATQLIVDGKPFLVLGAEMHNSSTCSLPYAEPVLAGYSSPHVNTALAAVTWEMLEPEEGKFDYSLVDGLIQEARRDKLRLILLSPLGSESAPATAVEVGKSYEVLAQMAPVILANQGKGVMGGVVLDKDHPAQKLRVGDYTLDIGVARHWSFATPEFPAGIFIQTGPDEFIVAGRGITVGFTPNTPGAPIAGLARVDDGTFVNGSWVAGRRLNGDEILSGKGLRLRGDYYMIQRVKLYR